MNGRTLWVPRVDYRVPLAVCSYAPSDRDATVVAGSGTRMLKMRNSPVAKYVHLLPTLQVRASSDEAVTL